MYLNFRTRRVAWENLLMCGTHSGGTLLTGRHAKCLGQPVSQPSCSPGVTHASRTVFSVLIILIKMTYSIYLRLTACLNLC